ncbi:MAG: hypothetical protein NTX45_16935 [Proteobacteria bacterium]|nr:hypothetical protein [Pseudomonadota bacterium]
MPHTSRHKEIPGKEKAPGFGASAPIEINGFSRPVIDASMTTQALCGLLAGIVKPIMPKRYGKGFGVVFMCRALWVYLWLRFAVYLTILSIYQRASNNICHIVLNVAFSPLK